jgi:hypothetical protein
MLNLQQLFIGTQVKKMREATPPGSSEGNKQTVNEKKVTVADLFRITEAKPWHYKEIILAARRLLTDCSDKRDKGPTRNSNTSKSKGHR